MDVVKVAHISDLHFSAGKSLPVWHQVCQFINQTIRPHLVLVTGDVTDNATHDEFTLAVAELGRLQPRTDGDQLVYRIVPGNHDRFAFLGNTLLGFGKAKFAKDKRCRFSESFLDHAVTSLNPLDLEFPSRADDPAPSPSWRVRVIGIDSNDAEQCFAQGYVSGPSISEAATAARSRHDRDLVIAMVHHHVLPIPSLEADRGARGGIKQLANVTGLLNSGTLLNSLSRAHVDVILHGHEHRRSQARFGSLDDGASNVVVLAAGSGTGAATGGDFDLNRVHFNVLELHGDRTVWLREMGLTAGGTLGSVGERQLLLTAQEIRQSRFIRRNRDLPAGEAESNPGFPRCRLKKLVRFTEQRDIEITETRTDWVISGPWTQITRNSSGQVGPVLVECQWTAGPTSEHEAEFLPKRGEPDQYISSVPLIEGSGKKAERMTSSWTWHGGAALTRQEIDVLRGSISDQIRLDGREYAGVRANGEFESLSLTVQLPFAYAPTSDAVKVLVEDPEKPGQLKDSEELSRSLDFCGRSIIELRIPFPMPRWAYYVTWPVAAADPIARESASFCAAAISACDGVRALVAEPMAKVIDSSMLRIGLYLPRQGDSTKLHCVSPRGPEAPNSISLSQPRALARLAWWGATALAERDDDAVYNEFCQDEFMLAFVPLRESEFFGDPAMGLLRIGIMEPPHTATGLLLGIDIPDLTDSLANAARSVLTEIRKRY